MLDLDVPEDELMVRLIKRGKDSGRADATKRLSRNVSMFIIHRLLR